MSACQDREIKCIECGNLFIWTAEKQASYRERGYAEPKRCEACRQERKQRQTDFDKRIGKR